VSLWAGSDFARLADACGGDAGADKPSSACDTFLKASEKAEQQWELEKRFQVFEAGF
jgi:adenosine deaminase